MGIVKDGHKLSDFHMVTTSSRTYSMLDREPAHTVITIWRIEDLKKTTGVYGVV